MQYNVLEARNQLSKLIDAAASGEEVVIAKRGKPMIRFVVIDDDLPLGSPERLARFFAENPPVGPPRSREAVDDEIREAKSGWRDDEWD
jgi:prevent-host-death family protein